MSESPMYKAVMREGVGNYGTGSSGEVILFQKKKKVYDHMPPSGDRGPEWGG